MISARTRADGAAPAGLGSWALGAVAFGGPFGIALLRAVPTADWRLDGPLLDALGMASSRGGALSSLLVQAALLLPVGPLAFRVGLAAAVALGGLGAITFVLARRLLAARGAGGAFGAVLAVLAGWGATVSATPVSQGTEGCGAAVVAALLLALVLVAGLESREEGPLESVRVGVLLGALLAEGVVAGGVASGLLVVRGALGSRTFSPRALALAAGCAVLALAGPRWGASLAGRTLAPLPSLGAALADTHGAAVLLFRAEVGLPAALLAASGIALGLAGAATRPASLTLTGLVSADAALAWLRARIPTPVSVLSNPSADLALAAFGALAVFSAVALADGAAWVAGLRLSTSWLVRPAAALFTLATLAAAAEDAYYSHAAAAGAERMTDVLLERLAPDAVVLVRTPPLYARLLTARATGGTRPDVTLVPAAELASRATFSALLSSRTELSALVRDMALEGRPSERSLTALSDRRPLFTELDPRWARGVTSHLLPEQLWLRFRPEPRGGAERANALTAARLFARGLVEPRGEGAVDAPTVTATVRRVKDLAVLAADAGDRAELAETIRWLEENTRGDAFVAELSRRQVAGKGGPLDARGLLR